MEPFHQLGPRRPLRGSCTERFIDRWARRPPASQQVAQFFSPADLRLRDVIHNFGDGPFVGDRAKPGFRFTHRGNSALDLPRGTAHALTNSACPERRCSRAQMFEHALRLRRERLVADGSYFRVHGLIVDPAYFTAGTMMGSAVLLQPCSLIFPSALTVPVNMAVVLYVVATLPCGSSAMTPPSPCCSTSSFMTTSFAA